MANNSKLHVVMFPWLAFGHIIPFFELSKFIAQKGHKISFVSTPRNIDRLPKIPSHLVSSITLVKIPLPKVEGLPESAEATMDIRNEDIPYLKKAFDGMETELTRFLENSLPDWVLYDFAPHWLPPVAARLEISRAFFMIINAWFLAFFGPSEILINGSDERKKAEEFMIPPKWVRFETKVAYRRYEANWIVASNQKNDSGVSDIYRGGNVIHGSEVIFIRHCNEFEPDWLKLLEELHHKPVIPVGLMPPQVEEDDSQSWVSIKTWLDDQNIQSVVYVALGSEVTPSQDQIYELALGLELSDVPFFWALRKPSGSDDSYSEILPDGFEERVKGRGMVWKSWAPQLKILSHDSVGAFLTHCGWSSFIEGLSFGHPLIALPFLADQGLNARIIADKQVGIEVPKNEEDGSYTKNNVSDSIKLVMVANEGKQFRDKAKEMSEIFGNKKLHDSYIDNFIKFLENPRFTLSAATSTSA
ncbi:putative UDP-rhamnose:rhamnosyltransferase 1 [Olea europaea var. sylvestris]|uniref:putative UDP-rhamnose:rhamnosyltransferase 1 n=1 Tax=Olea europaea var. sylvestris TaxID=158386 RepID=UPI000C1D6839|nr:putative UDP-rhamnose:rhamnosyltransferase 1 [Olea europaea var. sylvestris]